MKNPKPLELQSVVLVYLLLALISMLWDYLSRGSVLASWTSSDLPSIFSLVLAVVFVAAYVGVSQLLTSFAAWARELNHLFRQLLTPISYFQIFTISFLSGFVEEWFFRGVLLAHFGVVISSLLFALCHLLLVGKLWVWSLWSFLFGLIFAWIYQLTNSLLLCALIHFAINASVLVILNLKAQDHPSLMSEDSTGLS